MTGNDSAGHALHPPPHMARQRPRGFRHQVRGPRRRPGLSHALAGRRPFRLVDLHERARQRDRGGRNQRCDMPRDLDPDKLAPSQPNNHPVTPNHKICLRPCAGGMTKSVLSNPQIVFIAHSTGGLVIREMLIRYYEYFKNKKLGLFLVASPSRGSEWADRMQGLSANIQHKMALQLSRNSEFVVRLDKLFSELVARRKIWMLAGMDVFESRFVVPYWYFFEKAVVVDPDESRYYFGEPRLVPESDHFSISKPSLKSSREADSFPHEYLWEFYEQRFRPEIEALARCNAGSLSQSLANSRLKLPNLTWNQILSRPSYTLAQADNSTLTQQECYQRRIAELSRPETFAIENGVRCEGGGISAKGQVRQSLVEFAAPPGWSIRGAVQANAAIVPRYRLVRELGPKFV